MNRVQIRMFLLLAILIPILAYSSSNIPITGENQSNSITSIRKLLVLALTPIDENRETVEKELVYWLRKGKYNAIASFDLLPVRGRLPVREEVRRVLENNDFDGVLAIRLVDFEESSRFVSTSEKNATSLNETYFYNYLNAWNGSYKPGYYSKTSLMVIQSNLYTFPRGEIVHSRLSESFILNSFEGFVEGISKATVKDLKKSKILLKRGD